MNLDYALRRDYQRASLTTHETEPKDAYSTSLFPYMAGRLRCYGPLPDASGGAF